ncbi:MAG: Fe(3+) ABC transporter substrate-binding protein [Alphaproteobacteria bacterium]|jgi:iron(III) transport system substrate-binding protein
MLNFFTKFIFAFVILLMTYQTSSAKEVNIYSYRQPYLIEPMLDKFTADTGIEVNVLFSGKGLVDKMVQEGTSSPADVLLTVDIGRLSDAVNSGVSQSINSDVITRNIPAEYRDPDGHWIGLTSRARVVYASVDRVEQDSITYEELADPKWAGKICIRSGQNAYNIALIASMITHHGEADAIKWLKGLKSNLARTPSGNDRGQVKAIYSGECDISVGNTYYMAKMRVNEKESEQKEWAASAKIIMPNANDRGTHVNLSGAVLAKNAPNKENGIMLIEWLTGDVAQEMYAETNHEYPLKAGISISDMVASFGNLNPDSLGLISVANNRSLASEMVDLVNFDE